MTLGWLVAINDLLIGLGQEDLSRQGMPDERPSR